MTSDRCFSPEQKAKLNQLFSEGISIMQEVEDLNTGLSETIKAIAEEMDLKPSILKRAVKIAQKTKWTDTQANHDELESILETVNRTL